MIEIKRIAVGDDLRALVRLMTEIFGPRNGIREALDRWVSEPNCSVLSASSSEGFVGLSIVRVEKAENLGIYSQFGTEAQATLADKKVGSFQNIAILPEARHQGTAEALSRRQLEWLREQGCDALIGVCWNHGTEDSSRHLFEKGGFKKIGTSESFYLEGSRRSQHACPVCRGECRCSATLYILILS